MFYGSLLGGLLAGFLYTRRQNFPLAEYIDIAAPAIPLFHFFGRIGCFLGGCCYSIESPLGVVFHHSLVESANGVRRFPVQLIEDGGNLLLFLLLARGKCRGYMLRIYLVCYSVMWFCLEYLRGDNYRGKPLVFSASQIISLLILLTLVLHTIHAKNLASPRKQS